MDKTNIVNTFTELIDQLRNTECSKKEKVACFQRISECIISSVMAAHLNYATFCSKAVNILLLFCEDLDSVVRISAEENLNKIFRVLEKTKVSRILMDLYGEIKRNGNQRSLRICLRIFGYYAPHIREHNVLWYAQNLLPCMIVISKRKETLLQETLSEFVLKFGKHIQQGLTDSETCKLFEAFIGNIGSDCVVKRRCTAQNCINLIYHACNRSLMAKYALNKVIEILLGDHQTNTTIGVLGFLRQLVVVTIKGHSVDGNDNEDFFSARKSSNLANAEEARQMLEIYDYCLHLVSSTTLNQHSLINAALEVINSMLQCLEGLTSRDKKNNPHLASLLLQLMTDKNLKHVNYLKQKGTIKQQVFNLQCFENPDDKFATLAAPTTSQTSSDIILEPPNIAKTSPETLLASQQQLKRHLARSISECVDVDYVDEQQDDDADDGGDNNNNNNNNDNDADVEDSFTKLSEIDELHHTSALASPSQCTSMRANIEFTTKTISSSSLINDTISGHDVIKTIEERVHRRGTIDDAHNLLVNISSSSDDEKSNQLYSYNTDNESINSIESKAEISRGLVVEGSVANKTQLPTEDETLLHGDYMDAGATTTNTKSNNDALTSFFNNFNAASESVTKLFRPSTTTKNFTPSANSSTSTTMDTVSLVSNASSFKQIDTDAIDESSPDTTSKTFPTPSTAIMGEIRSLDSVASSVSEKDVKQRIAIEKSDISKRVVVKNPFLTSTSSLNQQDGTKESQLNIDIGSIYEQSLIYYTARLIAARFLLTGYPSELYDDTTIRVSIKSVCLSIIAQCVRVCPQIMEISVKFMESEKVQPMKPVNQTPNTEYSSSPLQVPSDNGSNIVQDYEHVEVIISANADATKKSSFAQLDAFRMDNNEAPLLEIIDDHFGKSTTDFNFTQPAAKMTRSADPVLFSKTEESLEKFTVVKTKKDLTTSEIISSDTKVKDFVEITKAEEDTPPIDMAPPKPPKRTKTIRKSKREAELTQNNFCKIIGNTRQFLYEVLFYYNHEDPILRAGVQTIIGHYCRSTQADLCVDATVNLQYLLAILCVGLQDEIHTVVIQALNTFDKIFPYVISKYMSATSLSTFCHNGQQHQKQHDTCNGRNNNQRTDPLKDVKSYRKVETANAAAAVAVGDAVGAAATAKRMSGHFNDNDEIIDDLLNAFQKQTTFITNYSNNSDPNNISTTCSGVKNSTLFPSSSSHQLELNKQETTTRLCSPTGCCKNYSLLFISPRLLLNKLRLCHYNKYWLVQNKYAEVISNLNYASLRSYYGNNYTNSMNSKNYNRCGISRCNCCCCSSPATIASISCTCTTTCCHSYCCCSGSRGGYPFNGHAEDDVDNADFVCNLENSFIDELLHLIGEDDVRVREHASKCLCNFILQNAKQTGMQQQPTSQLQQKKISFDNNNDKDTLHKTYIQNLKLLMNFLDYSIFNDMSPALRCLLNSQQEHQTDILTGLDTTIMGPSSSFHIASLPSSSFNTDLPKREEIETVLAKVLYRLTNRLMSLENKNMQFGIILCTKYLLTYFSFADYSCAWAEFNFMEIFVKLSQYNYNTAVDLTCQSDLIDVSSKLIVGSIILQPDVHANRDINLILLRHTIKIINIYYHIFTNQKPLIMAKSQRVDLFSNAKELAATQCIGYFGNEYVYMKLYQTLKSAYDNYKITINEEAGSKLISLLKTCLNSMSACIEIMPHEVAAIAYSVGGSSLAASGGSGGGGGNNVAKSATDVNTVLFPNAMVDGKASMASAATATATPTAMTASGVSATVCNSVLKLIEETLQYLTKVINYAPEESIACLRQLLKYLFARNYGNRQQQGKQGHYPTAKATTPTTVKTTFMKTYFKAKCKKLQCYISKDDDCRVTTTILTHKQQTHRPPLSSSATAAASTSTLASAQSPIMFVNVTQEQLAKTTTTTVPPAQLSTKETSFLHDYVSSSISSSGLADGFVVGSQDDYLLLAELFATSLEFNTWKSEHESEFSKHIKLFEPLVIYCLTLFLKCNGRVQSQILELLVLLLDVNITYNILDSKNVIFDNIIKSLDIIESGVIRNGLIIITPIIKFLIKLSSKCEKNLITIPKIISIINNLLANYNIRDVAVKALKTLSYEIFLMTSTISTEKQSTTISNDTQQLPPLIVPATTATVSAQQSLSSDPNSLAAITENLLTPNSELDTQKEVILGMLEKFIESNDCQQVLSLLLLIEQLQQQYEQNQMLNDANKTTATIMFDAHGGGGGGGDDSGGKANRCFVDTLQSHTTCLPNLDTFCNMICQAICLNRVHIQDWDDYYIWDTFFKNNNKYLLGNSKEFMSLLKYIIEGDVANFSDLSYATIILSNVILKTEEIYLVNHIKLYLKNHPTIVEKLRQKQQKQKQQSSGDVSSQSWLLDTNPTTSKAAAATAAAQAVALQTLTNSSSAINEINYFATVLCDVLLECFDTILSECKRNATRDYIFTSTFAAHSQQFSIQYCRLVCHFVKVLYQLCFNSRLEDSLLASIRFTLNACESKVLNEYYNLLVMCSTRGCPTSAATSSAKSLPELDVDGNSLLQLQLELYNLLNALGILDPLTLLQRLQLDDISNHVRRALLNKVCHQSDPNPIKWNQQQVQHLFNGNFLNILIIEQFAFMCYLCEVDEENCSLFQTMVLENIKVLNKHSIVYLLRLVEYFCKERIVDCSRLCFARFLQILNNLYRLLTSETTLAYPSSNRPLQLQIERLARHLIDDASVMHDKNAIYDTFMDLTEGGDDERKQYNTGITRTSSTSKTTAATTPSQYLSEQLQFIILNDLENSCEVQEDDGKVPLENVSNIVDEKWIFNQLIKFSAQNNYDPEQIVKILLEIQSENKLQKIFNDGSFDAARILRHSIASSLQTMLQIFRNNCVQYNPHIHYMQPNPLARVALTQLMTRIVKMMRQQQQAIQANDEGAGAGAGAVGGIQIEQNTKSNNTDNNKQQSTVVVQVSSSSSGNNTSHVVGTNNTIGYVNSSATGIIDIGDTRAGAAACIAVANNDGFLLPITSDTINAIIHLCAAVIALMENIKQIEVTALIYIESKFIDKFLSEHLLRPEHVIALVRFIGCCCQSIKAIFNRPPPPISLTHEERNCVNLCLQCIDVLLHQKFIWYALNQQQTALKAVPTMVSSGSVGGASSSAGVRETMDSCLPLTKCERNNIICLLLDVVALTGSLLLENTIFYRKYKTALRSSTKCSKQKQPQQQQQQQQYDDHQQIESFENEVWIMAQYNPKVIFLGKLIETTIASNTNTGICLGGESSPGSTTSTIDVLDLKGINYQFDFISLHTLLSISISSLRFNLFYALAVTPFEIIQQQQRLQACQSTTTSPTQSPVHKSQSGTTASTSTSSPAATKTANSNSMLPIIPIESLSDIDILKSFIKRLSIFGFTTRQQFEEYFMTFLLLINKVYDENMVDQQEQFQIRSICLEAIMELLITYKTFPIVGNKLSLYHHTTRWNRINCDTISLKKLHEIQLIISPSNVFYHSNLERNLICDSVIGTQYFAANQFDLNFIWQQMENISSSSSSSPQNSPADGSDLLSLAGGVANSTKSSSSSKHLCGVAANTSYKNYQYFTKQSGVDYKSSSQLIFDVSMQMIEQNHILILPNLVKFTEICENREQIKQIWEKADFLKSHIPMDDTISHQHLIYLLCKTKSMLIPSHTEMLNLEALIKNYLKSSHLFVRCAALNGLLSLLESYAKTSTTIGKLSDELMRLKDIVLAYIDKHGLIEESPLLCSDVHTKLIWTLNYCLMEWTSKLDPQCNLAYHTKLSVTKLLKNSNNEQVYLSCLHGLERMIVLDNKVSSSHSSSNHSADNQKQMLRPCIEKLALDLAKLENEKFSIPALKLLLSCIYVGSTKQLQNTELSNGIVQDDPEIIAQQTDKVDILLQCIKTATQDAAWIYGQVLCQMIRDLVPPKEILTKVIKEFLAINQPHSDVIAMIVFQVFRSAIDSSFLQQLQDWLTCSLPTFLALTERKAVWSLSVVFLSASINLQLMKLFPLLLSGIQTPNSVSVAAAVQTETGKKSSSTATVVSSATAGMSCEKLGQHEIALFVTSAQDFYAKLGNEQKQRFQNAFKEFRHIKVYNKMLQSL